MQEDGVVSLTAMKAGQGGTVVDVVGGSKMVARLNAIGIWPGKGITKASDPFMRGPVTVEIDRAQIAIGFGMAGRILVRLNHRENEE